MSSFVTSPSGGIPCLSHLGNNRVPDDVDRVALLEQWFCSNFECCGFSITSFHALIEHFEEHHSMVVEADGKKVYPCKSPVLTNPPTKPAATRQPFRPYNAGRPALSQLSTQELAQPPASSSSFGFYSSAADINVDNGFGFYLDPDTGLLQEPEGIFADYDPQGYESSPPSSPSPSSHASYSSPSSPSSSSFPFSLPASVAPSTSASPSPRVPGSLAEMDHAALLVPSNVLPHSGSIGRKDRIKDQTLDDQGREGRVSGSSRSERGVGSEGKGKGKGNSPQTAASAAKTNKKREKMFKCPRTGCTKSYLNPNGLKYHVEKGTCTFDSSPSATPARSPPPTAAPAPVHTTHRLEVAAPTPSVPSPAPAALLASHYASANCPYPAYSVPGTPRMPAMSPAPSYAAHSAC
ncbi:hypothetical protein HGRIS_004465 [Hohenbuehelia grisea]|uniref:C2H2-type domain-containing protein n=1 Tax=Hohenbuehelia grisea TaxID=104357 RepID=A0ABR3JBY1_9AGAR